MSTTVDGWTAAALLWALTRWSNVADSAGIATSFAACSTSRDGHDFVCESTATATRSTANGPPLLLCVCRRCQVTLRLACTSCASSASSHAHHYHGTMRVTSSLTTTTATSSSSSALSFKCCQCRHEGTATLSSPTIDRTIMRALLQLDDPVSARLYVDALDVLVVYGEGAYIARNGRTVSVENATFQRTVGKLPGGYE